MYGWELLFSSWLMATRSLEVKHLAVRLYAKKLLEAAKILSFSSYFILIIMFHPCFIDSEILGCMVCILLGYNTITLFSFHIWALCFNGTSTWCCNGSSSLLYLVLLSFYSFLPVSCLEISCGQANLNCRFSLVLLCLTRWFHHLIHSLGWLMDWLMWVSYIPWIFINRSIFLHIHWFLE